MEGPTVGECLVEEWLRSLNLTHYTQAFLDNGYDDLEICKQIGEPDLDAIGVFKESHRQDIVDAVNVLKNQGSTHVYFILESADTNEDSCTSLYSDENLITNGIVASQDTEQITDEYAEGRRAFKTYPKLHLSAIIRDKLIKHKIKLTEAPFINQDGSVNYDELDKLAQKYASDLKTHPKDVLDRLLELLELYSTNQEENENESNQQPPSSFSLYSVCGQSSRSIPPPLPACPPPSHTSRHASFSDQGSSRHSSPSKSRSHSSESTVFRNVDSLEEISVLDWDTLCKKQQSEPREIQSHGPLSGHWSLPRRLMAKEMAMVRRICGRDSGMNTDTTRKNTDTLGRLFKAIVVKGKTAKKYSYRKVEGDLNASEITMSEEERINLMILVKEGKLTTEEAVQLLKKYENERRQEYPNIESPSSTEFGSQRRKKNSFTQVESSTSSLTSSPELSCKQQTKHYEGTGTQLYSPIQGLRKKVITGETKPKSTGFFGSPKGSPIRSSTSKKDKIPAEYNIDSPKEKKKSSFSSPFSRRKKSSSVQSKAFCESPKASLTSLLDDSGVFDSPSSSRRGSLSALSDGRSRIPGLSRAMSQDCAPVSSPLSIQQETVAIVHYSPKGRNMSDKCDKLEAGEAATLLKQSDRLVSFKPFSASSHSDRQNHAVSDSTVNAISNESVRPSPLKLKQSISSDNYEYAQHIDSYIEKSSSSQENKNDIINIETEFTCSDCGAKHPKRTSHPLGYCIYAVKDGISPKRRNSPSGTPPDSQSPKRQHISHSPDNTICKQHNSKHKHSHHSSPEHATETSPTGTLDSGSMKEGHYGSSSTMSVGSETSPSCTIERTTLKPVIKKLVKRTLDKQAPGIRVRSNSFSTGDEYLSSDQEDTLHKGLGKSFSRNQGKRHSMVEKCLIVQGHKKTEGHHSDHSVEMPSDPERKLSCNIQQKESRSSSESKSSVSIEDESTGTLHKSSRSRSSKPYTVDGLLSRLGLQHLVPIFIKHGYTTLRSLSDIEEGHLNQLDVQNAEERAKLLTAAQMISDYEDRMITSESGHSSICNSPCHPNTVVTTTENNQDSTTPYRSIHPSNLTIATGNHSDESPQVSPGSNGKDKRDSRISEHSNTSSKEGHPVYENIDNFENAIPVHELVLCNRACQSDFDLAAIDVMQHPSYGNSTEELSTDMNGDVSPKDDIGSIDTGAIIKIQKSKPEVPERTVSLGTAGSATKTEVKQCKDASTQHGGVLQMLKKKSHYGSMIKTNPVSGVTKVKTAEVRHLNSPQSRSTAVLKGSQTCPRHSSIPRLCSQHRKQKLSSETVNKCVSKKLHKEAIDLTNRPYTQMDGSCGIPVLLVQRYAEELQADLFDVATAFENIRTQLLHEISREMVINSELGDQCLSPTEEPRLSSVHDFLISIGLPMYITLIVSHNIHTVEQLVNNVHTEDLVRMGISDPAHIRRLRHWMKKLRHGHISKISVPGKPVGLHDKV